MQIGEFDGDSAYEVAVKNGFEGTEEQWLVSLKGNKGDKGDKGDTGTTGPAGHTPVKGTDYFTLEEIEGIEEDILESDGIKDLDTRISLLEEGISTNLTWKSISDIVKSGKIKNYFKIGDQIITKWKDTATNTEYEMPLDVVAFRDVTILDDNNEDQMVPGMILQSHFCTPFGVQFTQNQAFYHCNEALPAGTYYIKMGDNWGNNVHKDYYYQFTITQTVPAGGQLQLGRANSETSQLPDVVATDWRVRTYSSADSQTPIEILSLTEYTSEVPSGTSLGVLSANTKYNTTLNNLYSSGYGHNRWKNSAVRQFLNSDATKGNWYTNPSDDVFARKPDQLASKDGFLKGVDPELLAVIKAVKISTAINATRDSEAGTWDYTYDKFFLPSMEEVYCNPQIAGEGGYWPYWKEKSGLSSPNAQWSTNPNMITYGIENHSSAQTVRLRSAYRHISNNTWYVNSSGSVSYYGGTFAFRFAPACVIC